MNQSPKKSFGSRFGYIMVAAGAAIGLGNIWKFPYLAYNGGGGAFVVVYILLCIVLGHPVVEMETAIGRYAKTNPIDAFGVIHEKWKWIGWINVLCTLLIDMYYVIVSGYVLRYAVIFLTGNGFGTDYETFYQNFISDPLEPLIYAAILMLVTLMILSAGLTESVEQVSKVIMPLLFVFLIGCGIWALLISENALVGLQFYFVPDFSKFTWKTFCDACMQVMFSISIGWGVFTTLGASLPDQSNIRGDSMWVTFCDTAVAIIAGFVIIPSVVTSGSDMTAGPSLIFLAMPEIFAKFPGGRWIGFVFFTALVFAVISTYFTILEVPIKTLSEKAKISHDKAASIISTLIFIGGIFCCFSQGTGPLSHIRLPWWSYGTGVLYYNIYDWVECFSGYVLLPLGCLLTTIYCIRVWGLREYEKELTKNGRDGKLSLYDRVILIFVVPVLTIIVILNCFGFIK